MSPRYPFLWPGPCAWSFRLLTALLLVLPVHPAQTATFTVNSAHDVNDLTPGNGLCVAYLIVNAPFVLPFCTLRAAVEEANSLPGTDLIVLPPGVYSLTLPGSGEDAGATGDLDITDSLVLVGAGLDQTFIDGNGIDRIFDISDPDITVTVSGLTITNGFIAAPAEEGGGAIRNQGTLILNNVSVSGNVVEGGGSGGHGGGILNGGVCTIQNSTISANSAGSGGGIFNAGGSILNVSASTLHANSAGRGGGMFNEGAGLVRNATISGNRTSPGYPSQGGGLHNAGRLDLVQSTIARNTSSMGGGMHNGGTLNMINTLLADNAGSNCSLSAPVNSLGFNLDGDGTCGLGGEGDLERVDAQLEELRFSGGPTRTHALQAGSPAVDGGKNLFDQGIATDQRGVARPQGEAFDIGSFEMVQFSLVPFLVPLLLEQAD